MSYEYSLLQKQGLILYQIPPLASAKGHYLDTWKEMIWNGDLKVVSKSGNLSINFLNSDGTIFACAPIPHKWEDAIQKTVDSSRGFAIRIQNPNGKYAWVGLAFRDRNDAFDFNVCFSDYEQKRDMEANPNKFAKEYENMQDFSIKQGQKIVLSYGEGAVGQQKASNKPKANLSDFKFAFAPPGQTGAGVGFQSSNIPQNNVIQKPIDQNFGSWGAPGNQTQQPKKDYKDLNPTQQPKNDYKDFGNFDFGQSNTKNSSQGNSGQEKINKQYDNLLDL